MNIPARAGPVQQIVGVFDCLSARLASLHDFDWLHIGGYNLSASTLGYPDVGLLTLSENVDRVRRIVPHCSRPVLVDGDDGYGNHLNVIRLVKEMQAAGASAIHLEDQVLPKRCGHMDGKRVIPAERFVDKIKAFVDTRSSPDFLLFARTDALSTDGYDEAVERSNRYAEAGADVIFVEALAEDEHIRRLPSDVPAPLLYNWVFGGRSPLIAPDALATLGYTHMLQADVLYAVTPALERYFSELKRTGTYGAAAEHMCSFNHLNALVGYAETQALDRRYGSDPVSPVGGTKADRKS